MSALFEELAASQTPMGEISLRRRLEPSRNIEVYEVKLDDEFLMSSLFTVAEVELARLALAALPDEGPAGGLDVLVGGLGLGYTARAVLDDPRVGTLTVIEALDEVIDWHRRGLLPEAAALTSDPRTRLRSGDFFALADSDAGLDPSRPQQRFDAVLVDIDHSPRHVLHEHHAEFYTAAGLTRLSRHLRPGGVFALWSNDPPDDDFCATLEAAFDRCEAHVVSFRSFYTGEDAANTVYLAS